jgi:hypothetical protein
LGLFVGVITTLGIFQRRLKHIGGDGYIYRPYPSKLCQACPWSVVCIRVQAPRAAQISTSGKKKKLVIFIENPCYLSTYPILFFFKEKFPKRQLYYWRPKIKLHFYVLYVVFLIIYCILSLSSDYSLEKHLNNKCE